MNFRKSVIFYLALVIAGLLTACGQARQEAPLPTLAVLGDSKAVAGQTAIATIAPTATDSPVPVRATLPPTWTPGSSDTVTPMPSPTHFFTPTPRYTDTPDSASIDFGLPQDTRNLIAFVAPHPGARADSHITDIFIYDVDTGETTDVTGDTNTDQNPAWSPDGTKIAFYTTNSTNWRGVRLFSLCMVDIRTQQLELLTSRVSTQDKPSWSPDGLSIFFVGEGNPNKTQQIFRLSLLTGDQEQITNDTSGIFDSVDLSPDGSRLAFVDVKGSAGKRDIYIANLDGSGAKNLTNSPDGEDQPDWTADGQHIAFASFKGASAQGHIAMMNADGSNPQLLTSGTTDDQWPSWSPDASQIVYSADGKLVIMNADGTKPHPLNVAGTMATWRHPTSDSSGDMP